MVMAAYNRPRHWGSCAASHELWLQPRVPGLSLAHSQRQEALLGPVCPGAVATRDWLHLGGRWRTGARQRDKAPAAVRCTPSGARIPAALSSLSVLVRAFQPWARLVASGGMLNAGPVFVVLSAGFKRKAHVSRQDRARSVALPTFCSPGAALLHSTGPPGTPDRARCPWVS